MQTVVVQLTRKQLYDEIWEISASGVAKKYTIPYTQFLKQVKAANIPVPPSGYWTKISFGKPMEKIALAEPFDESVTLFKEFSSSKNNTVQKESLPESKSPEAPKPVGVSNQSPKPSPTKTESTKKPELIPALETANEPETIQRYGQTYNVYDNMPQQDL